MNISKLLRPYSANKISTIRIDGISSVYRRPQNLL